METKRIKFTIRIISYLLVISVTVSFLIMLSKSEDNSAEGEKNEISFTANKKLSEWTNVAENEDYILYANLGMANFYIHDKKRNTDIYGGKNFAEDDENVKRAVKSEFSSLLSIEYADRDSNISKQSANAGSVNKKKFIAKSVKNGVYFEFYFPSEGFVVPLLITLSKSGINATVPLKNIREESTDTKLTSISVLPYFRAASLSENGNIFIPDGCGALIPFCKSKTNYSGRIYGEDIATFTDTRASQKDEQIYLPVFGVTADTGSYLGIVKDGEARGKINTSLATDSKPFSSCYTKFVYREVISVNVSNQTFEATKANMFEPSLPTGDEFSVSYRFTDNSDYTALAIEYRNYLTAEKGIQKLNKAPAVLNVKLVGGVMHTKTVLGFPAKRVLPLTEYADAEKIYEQLSENGIKNVNFDYIYWNKSASDEVLTTRLNGEQNLGGKKHLNSLTEKLNKNGANLYFECNFTNIIKSQSGISVKFDTAKNVKKEPLAVNKYYYSTNKINTDFKAKYLLSADSINKTFNKFLSACEKSGIKSFSLNNMGSILYSDFSDNAADRIKMQNIYTKIFKDMKESGNNLMFSLANAYAFEYADVLNEIPIFSGNYVFESKSIPFYAIALHGLFEMSVPSVNESEDENYNLLKAVECGIGLSYKYGYKNTDGFSDSDQNELYNIDYKKTFDSAVENTLSINGYVKRVSNKAIIKHCEIQTDVYKTVFEDGTVAITNYGKTNVNVDGTTVNSMSYLLK